MNKLKSLGDGLTGLEQILISCTPGDEVITQYALGKIELFNLYALELNDPERAYIETLRYCRSYVKIYKELSEVSQKDE